MVQVTNRGDLAKLFANRGYDIGTEIGVLRGSYSRLLFGANPHLKLYAVDSWGIGETSRQEYHLRMYNTAQRRLKKYSVTFVHKLSMEAVKDFEDGSLDFVYIDANHLPQYVEEDIREWSKKVKKGGILSGHDYTGGIAKVVDDYVRINGLKLNLTTDIAEHISWWIEL